MFKIKIRIFITNTIGLLDYLIPKKNIFCFFISPRTQWDANQQALFWFISKNTDEETIIVDGNNLIFSKPFDFLCSYWLMIRSRVIIFDHIIPLGLKSKRHIRINLWHGTPLKKIRFHLNNFEQNTRSIAQANLTDIVCSNSNYDALLMSSAMHIPRFNVIDTGLPRNDYMLCSEVQALNMDTTGCIKQLNKMKSRFNKAILWAPTYRGDSQDLLDPIDISEEQQQRLILVLENNNICLLLRAHKFSKISKLNTLLQHPNVFDVSLITNTNLILRCVDLLMTDFSSIWIDYLLLNRPIVIYAEDYDNYKRDRGFIIDLEQQLPVPIIDNFEVMLKAIQNALQQNSFIGYEGARKKFHTSDCTPNKAKLVYKAIKKFNHF